MSVVLQLFATVSLLIDWVENISNWKPRELNVKVLLFLSTSYYSQGCVLSILSDYRFEIFSVTFLIICEIHSC
jgi:hypothetical protein